MENNIIIRSFQKGDETDIVDMLVSGLWLDYKKPLDYYKWKYLDNPLGSDIGVAVSNEKVVGVSHNINLHFKIGNSVVNAVLAGDSVTHSDYRGMGIYKKIVEFDDHRVNNRQFEYWSSVNPFVLKDARKRGDRAKFPYSINYWVKINDIDHYLKNKPIKNEIINKYGFIFLNLLNKIKNLFRSDKLKDQYDIEQISSFGDDFNIFWDKLKNNYDFIQERNKISLNWRLDSRAGNFKIFVAKRRDNVVGYLVAEVKNDEGHKEGFIIDILTLSDYGEVTDVLLKNACEYLGSENVNVVYFIGVKNNFISNKLSKYSFINVSNKTHNIYTKIIDINLSNMMESFSPTRVHFSYYDLF